MYSIALITHSYLRWLLLGLALLVVVRAFVGWRGSRDWLLFDDKAHRAFIGILNVQFLLGLVLYVFLSPISSAFFSNLPGSMKVSGLRFFGLEHVFVMVIAVAVAHIGRGRMKRALEGRLKHKRAFVSTLSALLLMLAGIPWPFMHAPRPLFRGSEGVAVTAAEAAEEPCPPSYSDRCASCHGVAGRGDGVLSASLRPRPRSFADPSWSESRTDEELTKIIREGGHNHGLSPMMPPHTDLSQAQAEALVSCVRSFARHGKP